MTLISNMLTTTQATSLTQAGSVSLPFMAFLAVIVLGATVAIIWELKAENANR